MSNPLRETIARARDGATQLPAVLGDERRKSTLGERLRPVLLGMLAWSVLGLVAWPSVVDMVAEEVTPARRRGLFSRRSRNTDKADNARLAMNAIYWGGGGLFFITLGLLRVPREGDEEPSVGVAKPVDVALAETRLPAAGQLDSSTSSAASAGIRIGGANGQRYELVRELGRGGMGIVHEARDHVLDRRVAMKELPAHLSSESELIERFRIEARALAKLSHPGIVQVHDLVEDARGFFMALELVDGGDLADRMEREPLMAPAEIGRLGHAMAAALAKAHSEGIVHRDFKPENVLMTREGEPKITDFGIAKLAAGPKLTQTGAVMGTPAYMSPEQASGQPIDTRTDVYALGITLYEMATGALPFEGETAHVLVQHLTDPPPPPREKGVELPADLESLILAMLAKEPGERPSLVEVQSRLSALGSGTG